MNLAQMKALAMGFFGIIRAGKVVGEPKAAKRKAEDAIDATKAVLSKKPRRNLLKSKAKRKAKRMREDWRRIHKP